MRLPRVDAAMPTGARLKLMLAGAVVGERAPDVLRVLMYRPELFGKAFAAYTDALLRRPSEFSVGERELFAAFVSQANRCKFCLGAHTAMAERMLGPEVVKAALADGGNAEVRPGVRASLRLLDALCRQPVAVTHEHFLAMRKEGISEDGIDTVVHIGVNFSIINRIADALEFDVPSAAALSRLGKVLLTVGYKT